MLTISQTCLFLQIFRIDSNTILSFREIDVQVFSPLVDCVCVSQALPMSELENEFKAGEGHPAIKT